MARQAPSAVLDPFESAHSIVHQGYTVLVARLDGAVLGEGREGLYDFDTRILSRYHLRLGGVEPRLLSSAVLSSSRSSACLWIPRPGKGTAAGPHLPQDAFEISVTRQVGCGMIEQLVVRNHSMLPIETELTLELAADFADIQEVGGERRQQGEVGVGWHPSALTVTFDYRVARGGHELRRGLRVRIVSAGGEAVVWDEERLRFPLALAARGEWSAAMHYESLVDGEWRRPGDGTRENLHAQWQRERASLVTSHPVVGAAFERAAEDLFALRAWELDPEPDAWIPNAGVPTYTGLFGRDVLTAAWQGALIGPQMLKGSLAILASTQAQEDSAWRDEEPGKMIHEMRRGPLSELDLIPQRAYYGTVTTPAMFVVALSELWHWTGDTEVLRRHRDACLRALAWADRDGDRDGDGFLEPVRRSPAGLRNQGWKDSDEAIRHVDGSLVETPLATIEEQAFHGLALERMAEILVALEEDERAEAFLERARELGRRWHAAFWMEEEGFYAMALDREKKPVRSIGSNPGHALATGLVPAASARAVADRLLAPDLFSGWGVRTLSSRHPSYNPLAYHLGTVWPVENATFALGFKRYGLEDHLDRLAEGLFDAAAHFQGCRLPEAFGGHGREETPMPVLYPGANCPQAWSASAVVQLVQTLLGVYPFAPAKLLALVRPRLPAWLDTVTLRRVRVGDARVSLRFERAGDGTTGFEVIEREGEVAVVEVAPPDDMEGPESWRERLVRWGLEHAPGRVARAARIALGVEGERT